MSFSLQLSGTPQQIQQGLAAEEAALSGQSQKELRDVRGAIDTLLAQNKGVGKMTLIASGHGVYENEQRKDGNLHLELRPARDNEGHESDAAPNPNAPETETQGRETQANVPGSAPVMPRGRRS